MHYFHSYIANAKKILEKYDGELPFSSYLKKFFSEEKKYGSRDRKMISALCYHYFRIGAGSANDSIGERLMKGLFLFSNTPNESLLQYSKEWNENIELPIDKKAALAGINTTSIFPFSNELSGGVDTKLFNFSFLIQPDLYIRIRPGKAAIVQQKLEAASIYYRRISDTCLAFANGTKLENMLQINQESVIQDASSQRVGELLHLAELPSKATVWDCCAASGGKSIMAYDYLPNISLTVSDVRPSIVHNLRKRFGEAGIKHYQSFVSDITNAANLKQNIGQQKFALVICDAPCSGSGTWSRTPEQLLFFKEDEIINYSNLQKRIAANTIPYVAPNGYFLYITCSVFTKENEEVVDFITGNSKLKLIKQELLKGYTDKADTMFAALFSL